MKILGLVSLLTFVSFQTKAYTPQSQFQMAYLKQVDDKRMVVVQKTDPTTNQTVETVVSNQNLDAYHPEMSPIGDSVAYSIGTIRPGQDVSVQIVIKNIKEDYLEEWTPKADQYIHAEFSGNARYLVFSGPNPKTKKQNIGIIDLIYERQNGPTKVIKRNGKTVNLYSPKISYIDSEYDCYAPAVSSNGKMIIYHRTLDASTKLSPKELIKYNAETKEKKLITEKDGHAMFPSLSADDRHVAFVSKRANQWDIHRIDLWTEIEKQVTNDENIEFTPIFAPDDSIYFTRFDAGELGGSFEIGIYRLNKKQVFHSQTFPAPTPVLDRKNISEYVPSFSGLKNVTMGSLPSFPKPERSSFGAISHRGKVFIIGGHQGPEHTYPPESFLDRVDIYDVKTKTWTQGASMTVPKHGFEMAAYGKFIYVFGGFAYSKTHKPAWQSLDSIERYNIETNTWEVLPQKLPRRRSSNVAATVGEKVFLIGGWNSTPKSDGDKEGRFHDEIDIFDLKTETATVSSKKLPAPKRRAFNASVKDGKVYLLGGISEGASHFDWIDNVTVYDTETQTFYEETKLPYATFAPGAGIIGNKLYFIGGMVLKNKATYDLDYVDDVYQYDLTKKRWTHLGKYLNENKGFPQVVDLPHNSLGILGGHTYIKDENGRIKDHPVDSFDFLKHL